MIEEKNFDKIISSLRSMSEEEKNNFFNKPALKGSFEGQTRGQQLYGIIAKNIKDPNEIKNKLAEIIGPEYINKYIENLKELRKVKQDKIMELTEHLYHFSQQPQLSELEPRIQHSCTLNEETGKSLCFAMKEDISPYIGKPASNDPNITKGISVFTDEPCLVLSGIDLKQYAVDMEKNGSYRYEVDKSSFRPLVSLSGEFTREYASEQTAKIINVSGPFGLEDIYSANIPIYYIPNAEDRDVLKKTWQQYIDKGMGRHQAMEVTQLENPDKMRCLNKDKKLQQQKQKIKSKITDKHNNENKQNKTDSIHTLRGLSTPAPLYKTPTISKENLQGLRYAYNSKLER